MTRYADLPTRTLLLRSLMDVGASTHAALLNVDAASSSTTEALASLASALSDLTNAVEALDMGNTQSVPIESVRLSIAAVESDLEAVPTSAAPIYLTPT